MSEKSVIRSSFCRQDVPFEVPLRPQSLADFVGQKEVCERLQVVIEAAQKRNEVLGHCLFFGPPGLGKTTLSHILAVSMGKKCVTTSGPVIEKPADLAGLLTNLEEGDLLFIDEIHRLSRPVEEYLYSAMEDFFLDIMIDSGPAARSVQVKLNRFTLVGATTQIGLLTSPMRARFHTTCRLDFYDEGSLAKIILRSAKLLHLLLSDAVALKIAKRSRGTPRIANHLLRWIRDYSSVKTGGKVDEKVVDQALHMICIDQLGLDEMDRKILGIIVNHYEGGPVGLGTIAAALGEMPHTVEEVYEPFLILQGLLKRTARGREATALAVEHLKKLT